MGDSLTRTREITGTAAFLLAATACAGWHGEGPGDRPTPAPGGSGLYVVLREDGPASRRVDFTVSEAYAVRADGAAFPLLPSPLGQGEAPAGGDRLWLSGTLPPGSYDSLRLTIRSAAIAGAERPLALQVPEAPVETPAPFQLSSDAGVVLVAALRAGAVDGDSRFAPEFVVTRPPRVASGLLGLASVGAWGSVAAFDKRSGALSAVLPVGRAPGGLAFDVARGRAYVAVSGADEVVVLDLLEERAREHILLRAGDGPLDLALTPDGATLLVANSGSDTLSFVDPISATETDRLAVGSRPVSLVVARDGRRAYVVGERSGSVTVVDIPSRSIAGSIATESGPIVARLGGRADEFLYVAHASSPYLTVADTGSLAAIRRVYVGDRARALAVDPRGGRIFLARRGTGRIEVFDPSSLLPIDEIEVPGEIADLAIEPEANGLGVLLEDPPEARIVPIAGHGVSMRAPLGAGPAVLRFPGSR
jgi:YVTN family beta-propeller protein